MAPRDKVKNPAYQLVDKATYDHLPEPDWGVCVDLCDLVNAEFPTYGKDAVKALKLKIQKRHRPNTQSFAFTTLETCMKNCGARFHHMVIAKDVLGEMMRLVLGGKLQPEVRTKILELVEEWATQLPIHQYRATYESLRMRGVMFPGVNVDAMPPMRLAPRSAEDVMAGLDPADAAAIREALREVEAEVEADEAERRERGRRAHENQHDTSDFSPYGPGSVAIGRPLEPSPRRPRRGYEHLDGPDPDRGRPRSFDEGPRSYYGRGTQMYPTYDSRGANPVHYDDDMAAALAASAREEQPPPADAEPVDSSSPEAVAKLRDDIAVAANSVGVLRDMIAGIDPYRSYPPLSQLVNADEIAELSAQCRAMRPRVVSLVQSVSDEGLLMSALSLNDDIGAALERYDILVEISRADPDAKAALLASLGAIGTADGSAAAPPDAETARTAARAAAGVGRGAVGGGGGGGAAPADLVDLSAERSAAVVDPFDVRPEVVPNHGRMGPTSVPEQTLPAHPGYRLEPIPAAMPAAAGEVTLDDLLGPMPSDHNAVSDPFAASPAPTRSTAAASSTNPFGESYVAPSPGVSTPPGSGYGGLPPMASPPGHSSVVNPLFARDAGGVGAGGAGIGSSSDPFAAVDPLSSPPPRSSGAMSAQRGRGGGGGGGAGGGGETNPFLAMPPSPSQRRR